MSSVINIRRNINLEGSKNDRRFIKGIRKGFSDSNS